LGVALLIKRANSTNILIQFGVITLRGKYLLYAGGVTKHYLEGNLDLFSNNKQNDNKIDISIIEASDVE
jgi:hypothetical protein